MNKEVLGSQPIFIIIVQGRLGNMLFDYAFLLSLRVKYPNHRGFLYRDKNAPGTTGYLSELETIFNIPVSDFAPETLMDAIKVMPQNDIRVIWEKNFACRPSIYLDNSPVTICVGYWQTETAFDNVKSEVRKAFSFNLDKLNEQTLLLAKQLNSVDVIALHVRRGDYFTPKNVNMYGGICTINYYVKALSVIYERVGKVLPVLCFSDDPDWVKSELPIKNSVVVDWNCGNESWQDMYLMSLCRHNIIANSTFSWWGAWLNSHPDKIVVAPYRCFNTMLTPEIHPNEWIKIYPEGYVKNKLIGQLEKNKIPLEKNGLFYGKMGVVVFLYHYASIFQDDFYENIAIKLMWEIFSQVHENTSIDYADGLLGIGCAIEYLHQNEFIEGDIDEILADFDSLFELILYDEERKEEVECNLKGLACYYQFRISGKSELTSKQMEKNKSNMLYLYEFMKENDFYSISEMDSNKVNQIRFNDSPGLMGMAGRELMQLCPKSNVDWRKLLNPYF